MQPRAGMRVTPTSQELNYQIQTEVLFFEAKKQVGDEAPNRTYDGTRNFLFQRANGEKHGGVLATLARQANSPP